MEYQIKHGPLLPALLASTKRISVLQGGGDAGKTVTTLQYLAIKAAETPNLKITVTAQDGPNLTKGALFSFQRYVAPDFAAVIKSFNKTEKTYTFLNGTVIEFSGFSNELDARGSERDYLFINEANSRTYDFFWQLQRKTRIKIICDFNPSASFWIHSKVMGLIEGELAEKQFEGKWDFFKVDHRANPFLTPEEHEAYESISDPDLFAVYSRGKRGKIKGLICGHFKKCQEHEIPEDPDRIIYSCDYGYTNDPTALVKIWIKGRSRWFKKLSYEPGISASDIKGRIIASGWQQAQPIYSEADANMINQLRLLALPVAPAIKGPGSIIAGISKLREYECFYVDDPDFDVEIQNYKWVMAQDMLTGKEIMTNQPVDAYNHIIDAVRMGVFTDSFRHR